MSITSPNIKNRSNKLNFVLIFCLSSIQFFNIVLKSPSLVFYIYYGFFIITVFMVIKSYKISNWSTFSIPILIILIAEMIAALNAAYSWGQSIFDSIKAVLPFMSYFLFFLLTIWKLTNKDIEKLIIILGGAYIIIYLLSFYIYPTILFTSTSTFGNDDRGFQRIIINGIGFLFLFNYLAIGKYLLTHKILWLGIYLLSLVCIIMTLTRTIIIFSILFSVIFIWRKSNNIIRFSVIFSLVLSFYIISQMNFYKLMSSETDSQLSYVKEDIRVQSANYYLSQFSPNIVSEIFGNGNAYQNNHYAQFINQLEEVKGYYASDIGYIGLYAKFGILAVIAFLTLIFKALSVPTNEQNLYSKYFLIFIFTISFIIDAPFNTGFIAPIILAYYTLIPKYSLE